MALVNMHELITNSMDDNKFSIGVFLDLSKSFDAVDHNILSKTLSFPVV